jgi:hypothetical protein
MILKPRFPLAFPLALFLAGLSSLFWVGPIFAYPLDHYVAAVAVTPPPVMPLPVAQPPAPCLQKPVAFVVDRQREWLVAKRSRAI